jgi:hypothetical protein
MARIMQFSTEFMLAIECCKRNFRGDYEPEVACLHTAIDWLYFLRLARFHRIEGLAWNYLSHLRQDVPQEIRSELSSAATAITVRNLQALTESSALLERFEAAGISLLFLKGLTLGALAYRNAALKAAVDIDLLVDPGDLEKAAELLGDSGYRSVIPKKSGGELLRAWHLRSKESVWVKDSPPLQIDLHTRAADNGRMIPDITVHSPRQWVEVAPGISLPTFAPDELFAYLAVHGGWSTWFRLKWISDFAALLHAESPGEIRRKYRISREFGVGRAAGQALLLAHEFFGTLDQNEALREELSSDAGTRRLCRAALRMVDRATEPTGRTFGTLPLHWMQLLLLPGLSFKLSELSRQAGQLRIRGR